MTRRHRDRCRAGLDGTAIADAILRAGNPTTAWNRTPHQAAPLISKGAIHAAAIEDAVRT
ncbi:NAD(P)-binding domain-containing protein [Nonomuraea sp. NPDC050328]|uniref:NAD(P)-binding domain-containing protein n=1 Tax=Nonomuraea sp. NPDC050328 TaxID=3364361 RepID=UPI0037A6F3D5